MKFGKKQLITTTLALLTACASLHAHDTCLKDKVLCNFIETTAKPENHKLTKNNDNRNKLLTILKILGLPTIFGGVYYLYNCSNVDDKKENIDKLADTKTDEVYDAGNDTIVETINESSVHDKNEKYSGENYTYEHYSAPEYLMKIAKEKYLQDNTNASTKDLNDYMLKFERCYTAAVILYGKSTLAENLDENNICDETLISIINSMLEIQDFERIPRPDRQIAFYLFSKFRGNYDDIHSWVQNISKHVPDLLEKHLLFGSLINPMFFDYNTRKAIGRCLLRMPIRGEKRGDGYAFISKCCIIPDKPNDWNDHLELTVSPSNKKTLRYIYNSPSTRNRNCDIHYEIK